MGIVTNKPKFLTDKISNFYKWDEVADIVISPEDAENRRKPDPSGINLAMKKLNCSPENTFFGDHFKDFEASKRAKPHLYLQNMAIIITPLKMRI